MQPASEGQLSLARGDARTESSQAAFAYVIATVMVVGMAAAVIFNYVMGAYLHRAYPFTTFLYSPRTASRTSTTCTGMRGGSSPGSRTTWSTRRCCICSPTV